MTRPESKTFNDDLMRRARLIAPLAILLSVTACSGNTRSPILIAPPDESAFCTRYFDKDHPPVWIYESDPPAEKEEKTDLLILWERECRIRSEV